MASLEVSVETKSGDEREEGAIDLEHWAGILPSGWTNQTVPEERVLRLCKLRNLPIGVGNQPVMVELCLIVDVADGTWSVYSLDRKLQPSNCTPLQQCPAVLNQEALCHLLNSLENMTICEGNSDGVFLEISASRKGVFKDATGKSVKAKMETTVFTSGAHVHSATIRTSDCDILVAGGRCLKCQAYRHILRSLVSKSSRRQSREHDVTSTTSHTNWRYLSTPEKAQRARKRTAEVNQCNCVIMSVTCPYLP